MSAFNETQKFAQKVNFFKSDLKADEHQQAFEEIFNKNKGDWAATQSELTGKEGFSDKVLSQLEFTHHLAEWSSDNAQVISVFQQDDNINSMRDIALNLSKTKFIEKVKATEAVESADDKEAFAHNLHRKLFHMEPTAMLVNMVKDPQVPILNDSIGANVAAILGKRLDFNIKTTSIYEILKNEEVLKNIPAKSQEAVKTQLKTLQRIVAVSPVSDAVPVLYNAKFHTALQISDMPPKQFMAMMSSKGLDDNTIAQIHDNAQQTRVRNEQMLMAVREGSQPTGVALIDKSLSVPDSSNAKMMRADSAPAKSVMEMAQEALIKHNLSWDLLFGDADFCECGECNSVYSAAAYFVELLNYLRNNNLDPDPDATGEVEVKTDPKDISGTPLEKLFDRRPDLGCLELTCQNTNTVLPYIDLVNEVMESYVVFTHTKPFNVEDETSAELLAEPQHTEYQAYDILQSAVYPFNLPYDQSVDAARIYLKQLNTSRHELFETFKRRRVTNNVESARFASEILDKGIDAEFLELTREEYIILTKEDFQSKAFMEWNEGHPITDEQYHVEIGLKPVCKYYGFDDDAAMLGDNGLKLIKQEFVRRTGIDYFELVDLLKTETINPCMPRGKSKVIMESLYFSYRFLQIVVQEFGIDKMAELLANMVDEEEKNADVLILLKEQIELLTDKEALSCPKPNQDRLEITKKDIICWVKYHFENLGKMIVIENGRGCVNGYIRDEGRGTLGRIDDCKILLSLTAGKFEGTIDKETGEITFKDARPPLPPVHFIGDKGETGRFFLIGDRLYLFIYTQTDSCDLDTALLQHLDGTPLTVEEYDRIHRFIRLWRKLGWTINETDKAIIGLSTPENLGNESINPLNKTLSTADRDNSLVNCLLRKLGWESNEAGDSDDCVGWVQDTCTHVFDIDPHLIHQLVAVKKLLDKTGLELIKLLCFWTTISTAGEKSLYQRLFLTHNILGIDKVFKADSSGNYLSGNAKLSDHFPAVMAALNLSADDIEAIIKDAHLQDELTLANLSTLYRYRLLSKVLGLRIPAFISILPLFNNILQDLPSALASSSMPSDNIFQNPHATLRFIEYWEKMDDAGFTYQQLNYIIRNTDDEKKPFALTQKKVLQLRETLNNSLRSRD